MSSSSNGVDEYGSVREEVRALLDNPSWDDGSFAPILVSSSDTQCQSSKDWRLKILIKMEEDVTERVDDLFVNLYPFHCSTQPPASMQLLRFYLDLDAVLVGCHDPDNCFTFVTVF